jgi:hypothetical protein
MSVAFVDAMGEEDSEDYSQASKQASKHDVEWIAASIQER